MNALDSAWHNVTEPRLTMPDIIAAGKPLMMLQRGYFDPLIHGCVRCTLANWTTSSNVHTVLMRSSMPRHRPEHYRDTDFNSHTLTVLVQAQVQVLLHVHGTVDRWTDAKALRCL